VRYIDAKESFQQLPVHHDGSEYAADYRDSRDPNKYYQQISDEGQEY